MRYATLLCALFALLITTDALAQEEREMFGIDRDKDTTQVEQTEAGQADEQRPVIIQQKDPALATVLSLVVTGAGQMYASRPGKGIMLLMMGVGGPLLGYGMSEEASTYTRRERIDNCYGNGCPPPTYGTRVYTEEGNYTPLYVGIGVGAAAWLYGVISASGDARKYNEEHAQPQRRISVRPALDVTGRQTSTTGASYGLQLRWRF